MLDNEVKKDGRKKGQLQKRDWKEKIAIKYATLNFFLEQKEYRIENALERKKFIPTWAGLCAAKISHQQTKRINS